MTLYAGETRVVWCEATVPDTDPVVVLTPTAGFTVEAVFFDRAGAELSRAAMSWVAANKRWEVLWATAGLGPGSYRVKCILDGIDGSHSWEYLNVRLNRNPVGG